MTTQAARLQRSTRRDPAFPRSRSGSRMPSLAAQKLITARDGYRCRFCGEEVFELGVRSRLSKSFPAEVPWSSSNTGAAHGAFLALNATVDHVIPHARGGSNEPANLVTACWPCNFSREDLLPHEIGIADPRDYPPLVDSWDGLSRLLASPVSPGPRATKAKAFASLVESPANPEWPDAAPLLDALEALSGYGVSWRQGKTLLVTVRVGNAEVSPLAVAADGLVEAPWFIGPHKRHTLRFMQRLAAAIAGAEVYETPKMWRVRRPVRPITLSDLVAARGSICEALVELASDLDRAI